MTLSRQNITLTLSIVLLIGAGGWLHADPGFEPALLMIGSLVGIVGIWPKRKKRYARQRLSGRVVFDYGNNEGRYKIGADELLFETAWSKAGADAIHIYNDPPSIRSVAVARGVGSIGRITNAADFDGSSRSRTIQEGEIAILQNQNGHYAAVHVLDVKDRTRTDDRDELTFAYVINPDGIADFTGHQTDERRNRTP